eukprot:scaffold22.g6150.t1
MRGIVQLLRVAARGGAAAGTDLGSALACGGAGGAAVAHALSQLAAGPGAPPPAQQPLQQHPRAAGGARAWQRQQAAGLASWRGKVPGDGSESGDEEAGAVHRRARQEREHRIRELVHSGHGDPRGALAFVERFFSDAEMRAAQGAARRARSEAGGEGEEEGEREEEEEEELEYMGEDYDYEHRPAGAGGAAERGPLGMTAAELEAAREEAAALGLKLPEEPLQVETQAPLTMEEGDAIMARLKGLRRGSQRAVLQKLLGGEMLRADPSAMREWEAIQRQLAPPENFRMKVVDIKYTSKGTPAGGLRRYSCMVVVGNGQGVLGWGQGKAAEVNEAVKKAYARAFRNLYPVPRFNDHTITEPMEAKYGQVKVVMYPKAAGQGIVASPMLYDLCKMAGIHDIGIKCHGSRNARNTVKAVFEAFDRLRTVDEILEQPGKLGLVMPPGRYGHPPRAPRAAAARAQILRIVDGSVPAGYQRPVASLLPSDIRQLESGKWLAVYRGETLDNAFRGQGTSYLLRAYYATPTARGANRVATQIAELTMAVTEPIGSCEDYKNDHGASGHCAGGAGGGAGCCCRDPAVPGLPYGPCASNNNALVCCRTPYAFPGAVGTASAATKTPTITDVPIDPPIVPEGNATLLFSAISCACGHVTKLTLGGSQFGSQFWVETVDFMCSDGAVVRDASVRPTEYVPVPGESPEGFQGLIAAWWQLNRVVGMVGLDTAGGFNGTRWSYQGKPGTWNPILVFPGTSLRALFAAGPLPATTVVARFALRNGPDAISLTVSGARLLVRANGALLAPGASRTLPGGTVVTAVGGTRAKVELDALTIRAVRQKTWINAVIDVVAPLPAPVTGLLGATYSAPSVARAARARAAAAGAGARARLPLASASIVNIG